MIIQGNPRTGAEDRNEIIILPQKILERVLLKRLMSCLRW